MFSKPKINGQRGFTLIELLVVISIISLLSSVVLSSLSTARAKARDARRKSDLKQLQLAMELYLENHNRVLMSEVQPNDTSIGCTTSCDQTYSTGNNWGNNSDLRFLVSEGLIPVLPKDPINSTTYFYMVELYNPSNNNSYCIGGRLENPSSPVTRFYVRGGEPPYQNPFTGETSDTTCI